MSGLEILALVPYAASILESLSSLLALANRGGVSESEVQNAIIEVEDRLLRVIDDIAESGRNLSAMEKNDIRTKFTSFCRKYRFDADQKVSMEDIRDKLSTELNCKIPESVIIIQQKWLQSRLIKN